MLLLLVAVMFFSVQRWEDFAIPTPLAPGDTVIIGFHGGRDHWDNAKVGVGRMAVRLRELHRPHVYVQTVENTKRNLALRFVRDAFDHNRDGSIDANEAASAGIILYGESFGGAAVVKFARQLQELGLPVLLTVQIDSVGRNDEVIPQNVRAAASLYQRNGRFIHGPEKIRAAHPARTRILGNWRFDYSNSTIDISDLPWYKTILRHDHSRMDRDPKVWNKVEELIVDAIRDGVSH